MFGEKNSAADFLKNFDFVKGEGTFKVKIFDLALSKNMDERVFGTTSQSGTPFYSSPEQLRGGF